MNNLNLYRLVKAVSNAMDLISKEVVGHNRQVAYITFELAREMGLGKDLIKKATLAGLIHDLGIFYLGQDYSDLRFDQKDNRHAEVGYILAEENFPDEDIAKIIRYHHHDWDELTAGSAGGAGESVNREQLLLSNIIFMANIVVNLAARRKRKNILLARDQISHRIEGIPAGRVNNEILAAFTALQEREYFWLDLTDKKRCLMALDDFFNGSNGSLVQEKFLQLGQLTGYIIDFRSSFTATHTSGVAGIAEKLAEDRGFEQERTALLKLSGYFHDIGKLAVPEDILEKPESLTDDEWSIMRTHTYHTYHCLNTGDELQEIRDWASYHHERLSGDGYPFQISGEELSQEARIMAVADVFTALTEDRPYRRGLDYDKVKKILQEMARDRALDEDLVAAVTDDFTEVNSLRFNVQNKAGEYYQEFAAESQELLQRD
ncbi:HD-GYP domain-containing protein [Halarsenatibacter silvermanii]|uniref:HD domain-containing protein n=1 Tax=Halarsenatibacter silvermanii TaxID=321763 RepID=A0A1G9IPF9_9FIRM|nr:HD domain-containing phosphohydrolase [Halarsenatibacter silvermanii]SDL27040.1 HD domain-containing protein [Halarsenatibacter silvermanii]